MPRRFFHHPPFNMLIFFVTSRCNSVCRTCFYWDRLNQDGDLTFDEIGQISSSMPHFNDLWFSGGEPTLREELIDIVDLFQRNNGISVVRLPTNGLLTDRLVDIVDTVCQAHPGITFHVNMALDGHGETHDRIRRVPGNFDRAIESLDALSARRRRYAGFRLFVNSVICKENHDELIDLGHFIRDNLDVDGHYFQIIRGNAMETDLLDVPMDRLRQIYSEAMQLHRHYVTQSREKPERLPKPVFDAYYLGGYLFAYETQFNNADRNTLWKMPCQAGTTSAVLEFDGNVRICELREPIGNVRDYDCNFTQLWESAGKRQEVAQMQRDQCDCTHICFMYDSLKTSPRVKYWEIPRQYLKFKTAGNAFSWLQPTR